MKHIYTMHTILLLLSVLLYGCDPDPLADSYRKTSYDAVVYFDEHTTWATKNGFPDVRDIQSINMATGRTMIVDGQWRFCQSYECNNLYFFNGNGNDIQERLYEAGYRVDGSSILITFERDVLYGTICDNDVLMVMHPDSNKYSQAQTIFENYCQKNADPHASLTGPIHK